MDDNAAHGMRVSGNNDSIVMAFNSFERFIIIFPPYESSYQCKLTYPLENIYVYSLALISDHEETQSNRSYSFIFVAEDMTNQDQYIFLYIYRGLNCDGKYSLSYVTLTNRGHQEYMFVKIHPSQKIAYIFTDLLVFSFRIRLDLIDLELIKMYDLKPIFGQKLRIRAVDLADFYLILTGFHTIDETSHVSGYLSILINLDPFKIVTSTDINNKDVQTTAQILSYNRLYDMSMNINRKRQMAIIGVPNLNKVILLSINTSSSSTKNWKMNVESTNVVSSYYSGFGRSVVWIDDQRVAIAVLNVLDSRWSQSQVWIYNIDQSFTEPLFVFPNNQQTINLMTLPLFLQIHSWSEHLFIVTDQFNSFFISSQPAGYYSVWLNNTHDHIFAFKSMPCISGTYKNESSFGPCRICPSQMKNPGIEPCSECQLCSSDSFCPLGSVGDVFLENYPSYTQTFSYPDTPDMNNYDDLLVQNVFTLNASSRCLLISPLFWTIIVLIICFFVWLIMFLPKICTNCPKGYSCRNRAKGLFKKADIVNEGERWIGGLFSFAIVLLFCFTSWFATVFLKLYPVESSANAYISCHDQIRNALFESSLQLPLPNSDGKQWKIFEMLEEQIFVMTIDLLNTAIDCSSITVQQNRPGVKYLHLTIQSCRLQSDNLTRSTTFQLPAHRTNIQINLTSPLFIGGMRICLRGKSLIDHVNILQSLDMCQLFWTANQTLSYMSSLHIVMIKVINVTKPLKVGGETVYHGRWSPTFAENSLSDRLLYEQNGEYLRYMSERTILSILISEQPFYLQNNQEPIVRQAELAFHSLLFCSLIIEIFAIAFLICRMIIIPFIQIIFRCFRPNKARNDRIDQIPSLSLSNQLAFCHTINIEENN